MAFYTKNDQALDNALFQNPTSEYRGTPFWAWNCNMTEERISQMVEMFAEMGMGGAHLHSRTGMANAYLSKEFMDLVKDAHKKFTDRGMLTWLYDEDRWPSGAAGGLVTKDHRFRSQFLVFSPEKILKTPKFTTFRSCAENVRSDERTLLGHYQVLLEEGWLIDYARIGENETVKEGYDEWYAYLEVCGDSTWFNNQAYVNTLDKPSMDRFIEITHDTYAKHLGQEFGKTVPSIFTDEPQFSHKKQLRYAADRYDVFMPFTHDLEQTFQAAYGHSLLDSLPELFWEYKDRLSQIRYQYHDHVCERFAAAFGDNIGSWCEKHGLMLTGHMMEEATLKAQTSALGEVMRCLRSFQLPGIDMLFERRELSTAKQAQSVSHQYGREGVMSELYGGSCWDYDFRSFKLHGDWQAALGITVRVQHLAWTSMAGEAKRDYPAPIGYQSPWYKEYKYIEDYFARINTVMTRGKADVRIGVIHPVESYWLYWGTEEKTAAIRQELDANFQDVLNWMLYGCLDFDFICESLLPQQCDLQAINDQFPVGNMAYDVIVVPDCVTLRSTTVERLRQFASRGGKVIFAGQIPGYVDALPSDAAKEFAPACTHIPFQKTALLDALEPYRSVGVRNEGGTMTENLIYQLRTDGDNKLLFLAHVRAMENPDLPSKETVTISVVGEYLPTEYDPLTGEIHPIPCRQSAGKTFITRDFYNHDSMLLVLKPGKAESAASTEAPVASTTVLHIPNAVPYRLSEPNVLVLDQAEFAFDDGSWQSCEELLRIDNLFRGKLGYPARNGSVVQPWTLENEPATDNLLKLRFNIHSQIDVPQVQLALENENARVFFNGKSVSMEKTGWYVDRSIFTVSLGAVPAGANNLVVEIPYGIRTNIENLFLLGNFGVKVCGAQSELTALPETLAMSDITTQGFPFYGGNITYEIPVTAPRAGTLCVAATMFRSPLLKMQLDSGPAKSVAFSPYQIDLPCAEGTQTLQLTVFGNRANTFGPIHNCSRALNFSSPRSWRTQDEAWAYEYQLKATGLLKAPVIQFKG